ncbi:MAG: methyl-accepting chemotaxis protein [Gemmatimonadetes bacterium]|nr:MAG: methyl-accepting chemotaxis protein [Gemmatimonadota bacterium]
MHAASGAGATSGPGGSSASATPPGDGPAAPAVPPAAALRGRFDRSFAIRTIRDFLLALTALVAVELVARLALALRDYATEDREAVEFAAERLASDVREIMLNRAGPTAARTVYPILEQTYDQVGLDIEIVPSPVTVSSVRRVLGFEPRGVSSRPRDGAHHEATVALEAETFCLQCHVDAAVGDVLGHVTVRRYRADRLAAWWREAGVTSVIGMGNVILHTIVLFLLLRVRMEPLLRLRARVAALARGEMDLMGETPVRTADEFGELAMDLDRFLHRLGRLLEELDGVLRRMLAVNERLEGVSETLRRQAGTLDERTHEALASAFRLHDALSAGLERATVEAELRSLTEALVQVSRAVGDDAHYVGEILVLEERLRAVAESGQRLLDRLAPASGPAGTGARAAA